MPFSVYNVLFLQCDHIKYKHFTNKYERHLVCSISCTKNKFNQKKENFPYFSVLDLLNVNVHSVLNKPPIHTVFLPQSSVTGVTFAQM